MDKTLKEIGAFKKKIHTALFQSEDILDCLIGNTATLSQAEKALKFKEHVSSHLFVEETITETSAYIFYDVFCPSLSTNVKDVRVLMYVVSHRKCLDDYHRDGFEGNRADVLAEMVEDALVNSETAKQFGIGDVTLSEIRVYNSVKLYGKILYFDVPSFR